MINLHLLYFTTSQKERVLANLICQNPALTGLNFEIFLFQDDSVRSICALSKYSSGKMLYICLLRMLDRLIHDLLNLSYRNRVILSLHHIDPAVQRQDSHLIQFVTVLLRVGLAKGNQLVVDKDR